MKNIPLNDLSRMDAEEVSELSRLAGSVISSGHFLFGSQTREFGSSMSGRLAGRHVVCVGNGTDALYLALQTIGVTAGSVVATVSNAGGYTTGAALRLGAVPVMVDTDPRTAQMSADSLVRVLTAGRVDAVVLTHLYGLMAGVEDLVSVCEQHGVPVVEDCAQAFGSTVSGRAAGTFGDVATFSFYPTKNLGSLGDAGAVAFSSAEMADRAQRLAQYGWGERYVVAETGGFNTRMDELQAAFLNHRLRSIDADNTRRREIVSRYQAACTGGRHMIHSSGPEFTGHLAVLVTARRESDRDALGRRGISTGIHYPVLDHQQPAWLGRVDNPGTPGAEELVSRILTLPCFPAMTEDEVEAVASSLGELND